MPSKSAKQARLMAACAHPKSRQKMSHCPPIKVAREFNQADKGSHWLKMHQKRHGK